MERESFLLVLLSSLSLLFSHLHFVILFSFLGKIIFFTNTFSFLHITSLSLSLFTTFALLLFLSLSRLFAGFLASFLLSVIFISISLSSLSFYLTLSLSLFLLYYVFWLKNLFSSLSLPFTFTLLFLLFHWFSLPLWVFCFT